MRKYQLPPNDPRFLDRREADLRVEMLEDLAVRRQELRDQLESGAEQDQRSAESRIMEAIREISRALGDDDDAEDPLWDLWESQLAAGEMPDL